MYQQRMRCAIIGKNCYVLCLDLDLEKVFRIGLVK